MIESSGQNVPVLGSHKLASLWKLPAADRLICASKTAQRRNRGGRGGKAVGKCLARAVWRGTDVFTIRLTMTHLHWLFKYRTRSKTVFETLRRIRMTGSVGTQFPGAMWKKKTTQKQTSCLYGEPIRSVRQVETRIRRRSVAAYE